MNRISPIKGKVKINILEEEMMKVKKTIRTIGLIFVTLCSFVFLLACEKQSEVKTTGGYMEEKIKLPSKADLVTSLIRLDDGTLRMLGWIGDDEAVWDSSDEGNSWTQYTNISKTLKVNPNERLYTMSWLLSTGKIITKVTQFSDDETGAMLPIEVYAIESDKNSKKIEVELPPYENDCGCAGDTHDHPELPNDFYDVQFPDNERILVSDANGQIHLVNMETGEIERSYGELGVYAYGIRSFVIFKNSIIVLMGNDSKVYDIDSGEVINNEMANLLQGIETDFVASHMEDDTEKILYSVNEVELRRVGEGEENTQLLDYTKTSFAGKYPTILSVVPNGEQGFFVAVECLGEAEIYKYSYVEEAEKEKSDLIIYALEANPRLSRAVALFNTENQDTKVELQIGVSGADAGTAEDAIKELNLKMLNKEGPDVFVLDGLPMKAYNNSDILLDISEILRSEKEAYFENILQTYATGDEIFVAPMTFNFFTIQGKQNLLEAANNLDDLAVELEKINTTEENIGSTIITYDSLLESCYQTTISSLIQEDGTIAKDDLQNFFEQVQRLHIASGEQGNEESKEIEAIAYASYNFKALCLDKINIGFTPIVEWTNIDTIYNANREVADLGFAFLNSDLGNVYQPEFTVGIAKDSDNVELSKQFLQFLLSEEMQTVSNLREGGGMSIHKNAFLNQLNRTNEMLKKIEGTTLGLGEFDEEYGTGEKWTIEPLTEEEKSDIMEIADSLDTVAYQDEEVKGIIMEHLDMLLMGNTSLEEVTNTALNQLEIYFNE